MSPEITLTSSGEGKIRIDPTSFLLPVARRLAKEVRGIAITVTFFPLREGSDFALSTKSKMSFEFVEQGTKVLPFNEPVPGVMLKEGFGQNTEGTDDEIDSALSSDKPCSSKSLRATTVSPGSGIYRTFAFDLPPSRG